MVKLGVPQEQSKALVATRRRQAQSPAWPPWTTQPVVQIDEGFDRAWRRVGLALDRTGFTVEDRDRSQGTYFVRYVEPSADKKDPGFFSKLFSGTANATPPLKFRIAVKSQGEATTVSVLNATGAPEPRPTPSASCRSSPTTCGRHRRSPFQPPPHAPLQKPGQRQFGQRHRGRGHAAAPR